MNYQNRSNMDGGWSTALQSWLSGLHLAAAVLVIGLAGVARSAGSDALADLKEAHSEAYTSIQVARDEALFRLKVGYEGALKKLGSQLAKKGDASKALAVREEIASFGDQPLGEAEMAALLPEIAVLRKKFDSALVAQAARTKKSHAELGEKYVRRLGELERELAKAGEKDAAAAAGAAHALALEELEEMSGIVRLPPGCDLFYSFDEKPRGRESPKDLIPPEMESSSKVSGWVESGRHGGGYELTRGDCNLLLNAETPLPEDALTISAWVKLRGYGDHLRLWDQFNHAAKIGYACNFDQGHPVFEYWDQDGQNRKCRSPRALDLEKWHHVTFTYDSARCVIYVDGEICVDDAASPIAAGKRRVRVGAEHADGFHLLNGTIDDLIHYPRALDRKEAQALFKARLVNSPVRF